MKNIIWCLILKQYNQANVINRTVGETGFIKTQTEYNL